jgi:LAO/AO transport system kinase
MSGSPAPALTSVAEFMAAIQAGERRALARAITLIESRRPDRQALGQEILEGLVSATGGALRVGLTGPPGVGKSSFIEALGLHLLELGLRVAVLAVDPSSPVTGGSILGDKTRMERLAQDERAFIRPSPSGGALGGVAHRTREALLLCEAAGFDVVIVETVGIGQSEMAVRSLVDFFCVLLQPGAGDELQGLKRGVLELADVLVVNKADGEQKALAERTRGEFTRALELLRPLSPAWRPPVLAASARTREGIAAFWGVALEHGKALRAAGEFEPRRRNQAREWMWTLVEEGLQQAFRSDPRVASRIDELESEVAALQTTPAAAARALLASFAKR